MRQGFAVICGPQAMSLDTLGQAVDVEAVAAVLGSDAYTTRQRLVGTGVRTLLHGDDRSPLAEKSAALTGLGVGCAIHVIDARHAPERVRAVVPDGEGLRLLGLEDREIGRLGGPGPKERFLGLPLDVPSPNEVLAGRPTPRSLPESACIDLVAADGRWFRFRFAGFNFVRSGSTGAHALAAHVAWLVRQLDAALEITWHLGYPPNFGRPIEAEEARDYPLRVRSLWVEDLLPTGALAAAAAAGPAPEVGGRRLPRDPAALVPIRRQPPSALAALLPQGEIALQLGLWAVSGLVSILLVGHTQGELFGRAPVSVALLLGGAVGVALGLRALGRWQHVADTPTSRIRSVSMGKARISGQAECETPLFSPWAHQPCVWYMLTVERRVASAPSEDVGTGLPWARSHRIVQMARRDAWETLVCGDSGDLPFRLKDETGSLRIDPGGATFLGGESDVHHAESGGQHFRVTERLLPVGAHLFAVGTVDRVEAPRVPAAVTADALRKLRQDPAALARFDLDGNGRIDAEEWEVARQTVEAEAAAMTAPSTDTVVTMRRGRDGVLLVGDGSPSRSTQRLRLTAMGATALGVLAMLVGLFSLRGGA